MKSVETSDFEIASSSEQSKLDGRKVHDCAEGPVVVKFANSQEETEEIEASRMNVWITPHLRDPITRCQRVQRFKSGSKTST